MGKALNVLKDLCLVINFNSYWQPRVHEAIAELEEAMKHKTCEGCVRQAEDMVDPHCAFCSRACKDNYEPKEK